MKSTLGHVYLYVSNLEASYKFYKPLLGFLDYKEIFRTDWGFAFISGDTSVWFQQAPEDHLKDGYHRRRVGLNHLAFKVNSKDEVDRFCDAFLTSKKIKTMYETPKDFSEYVDGYYAVFFEDPDKIKLEVAYYP